MDSFKAILVRENQDQVTYQLEDVNLEDLSPGEVLIQVDYSTVNYKDMLAFQKKGGVIRDYPMIPGVDLSGRVISSDVSDFNEGDEVLINGTDLGVSKTGGFAQYARSNSKDITKLPQGLSAKDAMIYGTAGFTAALSIQVLEDQGMSPDNNPEILVTGSTGGVGSVAIQILKKAGYKNIHALVRKDYQVDVAKKLGASHIVQAKDFNQGRNTLETRNFHYVVDTVGGEIAGKALARIKENGIMTSCGNAGGINLEATVFPFILRGVSLLGINSVNYPKEEKKEIWDKLSKEWYVADQLVAQEIGLKDLDETIQALKEGKHLGRTLVKVSSN